MSEREFTPAFPLMHPTDPTSSNGGMDLRDYFAAQFISGVADRLTANVVVTSDPTAVQRICQMAYAVADTMMEARKR